MDNTLFNRYALALLSVAKEENKVEEYRLYLKEIKEERYRCNYDRKCN